MKCSQLVRIPEALGGLVLAGGLLLGGIAGRVYLLVCPDGGRKRFLGMLGSILKTRASFFDLLQRAFLMQLSLFLAACFFSMVLLGGWYYLGRIALRGIGTGFLFGALCQCFGMRGCMLGLAFYLPQWFLYAPVFFCLYRLCYGIWHRIFREKETLSLAALFLPYRMVAGKLLLLLFAGAVLEAGVGAVLLRTMLRSVAEKLPG